MKIRAFSQNGLIFSAISIGFSELIFAYLRWSPVTTGGISESYYFEESKKLKLTLRKITQSWVD